ncbi:MAG TPA: aspartate-semialdehyde dehydrogenase [Bacteroidales bacterium]|jgi:aspartate-semialdehyde dehydrogenase|nr:aspartate-semialdehyde dehydrogenase [Bacteroidales bacterium]MCZ2417834.1 aspartate-semialdehyde dehydrogenase [Burkholderiales bacterium]OQC58498.1 MAG: Aspartate-semialdehyde dehydrogenase 2 [Bacteroidetes bacterium ADurb.Bin013]MBV6455241.1 Aspartate-semialdehyde dehydrogenase 2 [Bacteroidales bacterium]MCZ2317517.1 aspartate-semialdehyde dehydrogenase [Bacteroidales bacterium]
MNRNVMVAGATGLVGRTMIKILEERNFPADHLVAVASERPEGRTVSFRGKKIGVTTLPAALKEEPGIAFFSAGKDVSGTWAPLFVQAGWKVVDNSSCWRMSGNVKLVVPEINGSLLSPDDRLVANPNCSTIQMVLALAPLHNRYRLQRIVACTYQAVTGSGQKGVERILAERKAWVAGNPLPLSGSVYPCPIDLNVIPDIGALTPDGYTEEEIKMREETRKILGDAKIGVSATCVRVPVIASHCVAVNARFAEPFSLEDVCSLIKSFPGLVLNDFSAGHGFAVPLEAEGTDTVYVGRIRRDPTEENTLELWTVADNLRKGAALNAIQIGELLLQF